MAIGGKRPKPMHLRLVDGTHRPSRHGSREDALKCVEIAAQNFGKPVRPKYLKGAAADAWKLWIEPASWLDDSRGPAAIAFCELWKEFRDAPTRFPSAKHSQMRAYMSELGLIDERNRLGADDKPKDEFFGD